MIVTNYVEGMDLQTIVFDKTRAGMNSCIIIT